MGTGAAGVPLRELGMVLLVALSVTYLSTGVIRWAVVRSGWIDQPRSRDVHTLPRPRLGGVAMFSGFLAAVYLADQLPALTRGFRPVTPEMDAVVWAGFIIVVVGIIDDLWDLDAVTKLIGQMLAAVVMSGLGLTWTILYWPGGGGTTFILDQFTSTVVTALITVMLINAMNFVDGLDGLAAGIGGIAGLSILLLALIVLHDQGGTVSGYPPAIIAAALVGICAGFLPHNFSPSRIFMGDSGSMLLGLVLAAAATSLTGKINQSLYGPADTLTMLAPILVVFAALSVPLIDLVAAVIRRTLKGQSPFKADAMHLHHRLLAIGHTHRRVVLVIYTWVALFGIGAVFYTIIPRKPYVALFVVAVFMATVVTIGPVLFRTGKNRAAASRAGSRGKSRRSQPRRR
ncbi:MraY family glycosyltransferase [Corynebacterium mendelii]|uniref:Undecaprenyl/decaprenyl-phosphate alpha-N-acetylglucosaminyl 1-phosphate transferase n=1 Tax=Corynebacterium mendelii TaxID=2765362 RepID=A0A939IUH6_9CORY|nr:MraY family glycosyltransferase [Corynebacterium mendelii]MBN9644944.1 undecaprenyl/decaprenyl-phosphate alpha-N-acetylglucosaminyl 1-phosphate transferase [Corynebacterium mendelii]